MISIMLSRYIQFFFNFLSVNTAVPSSLPVLEIHEVQHGFFEPAKFFITIMQKTREKRFGKKSNKLTVECFTINKKKNIF